ncbi:kinase-like protein [Gigaspora margarita]|uniref:Kinase-like protein n=1 Tax=Gigaspora margarita TaxID=4874 RepID=A0A8H3XK59_GIGMA|nr:kinase-like protein [Gigaspora margarita]
MLWEISSDKPLFDSVKISRGANIRDSFILIQIRQGIREQPIEGTPDSYIRLYKRCWDHNPDLRPTIEEISKNLSNVCSQQTTYLIINYTNISDFSVNSDNNYESNDDTCPKNNRISDSRKDNEINMSKISNASQPPIILNN